MIIKNHIEKPFGPSATTTGIVLLIAGIIYTFLSLNTYSIFIGIAMFIIGSFIGFSRVSTFVNLEKREVKFSNVLFGIYPAGKWLKINNEMTIGLENSRRGFRTYSRGMRTNDAIIKDIRIVLYDSKRKRIGPIKKFNSRLGATEGLEELSKTLGVEVHRLQERK